MLDQARSHSTGVFFARTLQAWTLKHPIHS
jgi:hypothetical protein